MNNEIKTQKKYQKNKRRTYHIKRRSRPGASPGTLVTDPLAIKTRLHLFAYSNDEINEYKDCSLDVIKQLYTSDKKLWINVKGLGDLDVIKDIGTIFNLHNLSLEDVINNHQRPKAEEYDDYIFITTRMPVGGSEYKTEQVSLFLTHKCLISFQETQEDCFEPVRTRLRKNKSKISQYGPDYLAYTLLDAVVDNYFPMLEVLGEELEDCEYSVINNPRPDSMEIMQTLKHILTGLR